LIAYNQRHAAQVMPWFGQEYLEQAAATHGIGDLDYQNARQRLRQLTREQGIDALLTEHRLDALIAPTTGPAWKTDWLNGGNYLGGSAGMAAMAGTRTSACQWARSMDCRWDCRYLARRGARRV